MSYRVTIYGPDYDAMADLVRRHHVGVFGNTARRLGDEGYAVDAFLTEDQIEALEGESYRIERIEDFHARDTERYADVGKGNRYAAPPDTRDDAPPPAALHDPDPDTE